MRRETSGVSRGAPTVEARMEASSWPGSERPLQVNQTTATTARAAAEHSDRATLRCRGHGKDQAAVHRALLLAAAAAAAVWAAAGRPLGVARGPRSHRHRPRCRLTRWHHRIDRSWIWQQHRQQQQQRAARRRTHPAPRCRTRCRPTPRRRRLSRDPGSARQPHQRTSTAAVAHRSSGPTALIRRKSPSQSAVACGFQGWI